MLSERKNNDSLKKAGTYIFSVVCGMAASALILVLCAFVMYAFGVPPYSAGFFALFALGAGSMLSGFICALIKKSGGMKHGFRCAVIMSLIIIAVSLLNGSFDGSLALSKLLTAVITGCTGGIIGVNLGTVKK